MPPRLLVSKGRTSRANQSVNACSVLPDVRVHRRLVACRPKNLVRRVLSNFLGKHPGTGQSFLRAQHGLNTLLNQVLVSTTSWLPGVFSEKKIRRPNFQLLA